MPYPTIIIVWIVGFAAYVMGGQLETRNDFLDRGKKIQFANLLSSADLTSTNLILTLETEIPVLNKIVFDYVEVNGSDIKQNTTPESYEAIQELAEIVKNHSDDFADRMEQLGDRVIDLLNVDTFLSEVTDPLEIVQMEYDYLARSINTTVYRDTDLLFRSKCKETPIDQILAKLDQYVRFCHPKIGPHDEERARCIFNVAFDNDDQPWEAVLRARNFIHDVVLESILALAICSKRLGDREMYARGLKSAVRTQRRMNWTLDEPWTRTARMIGISVLSQYHDADTSPAVLRRVALAIHNLITAIGSESFVYQVILMNYKNTTCTPSSKYVNRIMSDNMTEIPMRNGRMGIVRQIPVKKEDYGDEGFGFSVEMTSKGQPTPCDSEDIVVVGPDLVAEPHIEETTQKCRSVDANSQYRNCRVEFHQYLECTGDSDPHIIEKNTHCVASISFHRSL